MIDERLFSDLVELYNQNVKTFQEKNTGLIIETIYPLEIEDIEEVLNTKALVDYNYIKSHFIGFTINPLVTELHIRNNIHRVEIRPDISWEKEIYIN